MAESIYLEQVTAKLLKRPAGTDIVTNGTYVKETQQQTLFDGHAERRQSDKYSS